MQVGEVWDHQSWHERRVDYEKLLSNACQSLAAPCAQCRGRARRSTVSRPCYMLCCLPRAYGGSKRSFVPDLTHKDPPG